MNSEVYKTQADTPDELLASSLYAAVCVKKRDDQLRPTTRDLHTRAAKCAEISGEVYRTYIANRNKSVVYVSTIRHLNLTLKLILH
jgi:hypothetical protein